MGWVPWDTPAATGPIRAAVFITTILVSLLTSTAAFGLRDSGQNTQCDFVDCFDLYEDAQTSYGVRVEYPVQEPGVDMSAAERRTICITIRTFHRCMNTKKRECLSDLSFHGAQRGIEKQMNAYKCNETGETFIRPQGPIGGPPHNPLGPSYRPAQECLYPGHTNGRPKKYSHCGLFGDPHLRTFTDQFQTCRVQGAWPLIVNDHITVQVTNEPVGIGTNEHIATATTKLTVVIKQRTDDQCADSDRFVTYQAQNDHLPAMFDDGRVHFGNHRSVRLTEKEPGQHVEIYLSYIDTTIVVRKIGSYLTFAIQIPEELVNQSLGDDPDGIQLCSKGCPASELIDYKEFLALRNSRLKSSSVTDSGEGAVSSPQVAMTRETAARLCAEAGVVDFYFDSCVFDLITTRDLNFTMAAYHAFQDVLRLYPAAATKQKNRTTFTEIDTLYRNRNHATSAKITNLNYMHRTTYVLLHVLVYVVLTNLVTASL